MRGGGLAGLLAQALGARSGRPAGSPRRRSPAVQVVVHNLYNPENITAYNIVPGLLGVILTMTMVMMTAWQ